MRIPKRMRGRTCLATLTVISMGWLLAPVPASAVFTNGKLQVIHLDAGQGDGAVVITPGGQVAMIDDGTNFTEGTSPPSCSRVLSELQALGVTHVDVHFASHYHADHIGCITSLTGVTIDQGWDRSQSYTSSAYTNYANYLTGKRYTLTKGQVITLDSLSAHPVTIKCVALLGDGISTSDENAKSLVLKVSYGEYDEVFGGDLTGYPSGTSSSNTNIETKVGPQVGPVEVYKVHHHGSAYASYDDWLNATTPKVGIISCGTGNNYGHPTASALTRLHAHHVRTYWTETGSGVAPNPTWDKVAGDEIKIYAVWQPGGVDSILAPGIADTLTNSGSVADAQAPVAHLTSPAGGEDWKAGSSHAITWTASDNVGVTTVDLAYSTDGGASFSHAIASGLANSGSFSWTVPNAPSSTARVRVTAHDAAGNLAADSTVSNFTIDLWAIQASAGSNGALVPNGILAVVQGASQHFSIAPAAGYQVGSLTVDGASVAPDTTYTFTNVTANHTLAAAFAALGPYTITASGGAGGSIAPSGAVSVAYGASQSFTIVADACEHVAGVTVDGASVGAVTSYAFTNVNAAHTIAASFALNTYGLAASTVGSGSVARSPDQASYPCGASVQITATANAGWAFAGWSGDTTTATNPLTLTLTRDRTLTATFTDVQAPIVQVLDPVGGERLTEGAPETIRWSATDNGAVDSLSVDYSLTGPSGPWLPIARGLANTGSYAWTVPGQSTDSALVRIVGYDHALNATAATSDSMFHIGNAATGVDPQGPAALMLARPEPNPSTGATRMSFSLPQSGHARLEILDLSGRRAWEREGSFPAGRQTLRWDGTTTAGARVGSGLYFVRLTTPWGDRMQRLVLIR